MRASDGAPIPVPRQPQALAVDLDPHPIARGRANHLERVVIGAIIRHENLERDSALRHDAAKRLAQVAAAVEGGNGNRHNRATL